MSNKLPLIFVTGATGAQGGAAARELLAAGYPVRFLTRNPDSLAAQKLIAEGAQCVTGDLNDTDILPAAMQGAYGVFSVQVPDGSGADLERRHGKSLIDAALRTGVTHFIHTSVCEAGKHTDFPRWDSGYWWQKYWTDKWDVEEAVRTAGFTCWTILKPAFMMDNFALPKARHMFPHLRQGEIVTALRPSTCMQLIAADDVGVLTRAALADPQQFNQQNIDLAAEALSMDEVAAVLSRTIDKPISARSVTPEEAIEAGLFPGWVRSQEWTNEVGYRANITALNIKLSKHGIELTRFVDWATKHAEEIHVDA